MMITCKSPQYRIKDIKKTKDSFLSECSIGDLIVFIVPLKGAGTSRGRTYASYITVLNITKDVSSRFSFNQLDNMLEKVELE